MSKKTKAQPDPRSISEICALLSRKEREVVTHYARGLVQKEVAAVMGLAKSTVSVYRARAMKKLRLKTTAQLMREGIMWELGAIQPKAVCPHCNGTGIL